jgi:hypothetical protein
MGFPRFTLALVGFVAAGLLWATPGRSQTVTVTTKIPKRSWSSRPSSQNPTWINYEDCKHDDQLTFDLTMAGAFVGKSLEVWVGSSNACTDYAARQGTSPTCWQIYKSTAQKTPLTIVLRARDIIGQHKVTDPSSGPGSGTLADCEQEISEPFAVTLNFLLLDGAGQIAGTGGKYETKFDLMGPAAPTSVHAGVGEDRLIVGWDAVTASDLLGFRAYCDPKPGAVAPANHPMAIDGAAGGGGAAGAGGADAASGDASTDAGSDAGAAGAAGAGGSSGGAAGDAGGEGGNPSCPSDALVPGKRPSSEYECGSIDTKTGTSMEATGLMNGVNYAVAVAAVDDVGNSGPLSRVACGTPQPVNDFFELYRQAGGKGGGGFCALGADPRPGALLAFVTALGALLVRRRRPSP